MIENRVLMVNLKSQRHRLDLNLSNIGFETEIRVECNKIVLGKYIDL